jgi:predicted TIM-barrel fold metal-dependent hydrolase
MSTRLIDIHPHIISQDTTRYPITPLGGKQSAWSRERPVTFEQLIAAMDEAGVDKAAIVHSSTTYGHDNSYLADCVALQPKRFTGVFSVDMLAADAPEKIRYWVKRGLSGLRLFTAGSTMEGQAAGVDDPRSFPGWECAGALGIPVCMQMLPEGVPQLLVLIKRFPTVRIIIDHLMKPPIEDGPPYAGTSFLFDLAQYPNVYLKLTTRNVRAATKGKATPETFFFRVVKEFGASRIAWGSNYPASTGTLPEIVKEAKSVLGVLPAQDQEWIFSRTAQVLYPALADK